LQPGDHIRRCGRHRGVRPGLVRGQPRVKSLASFLLR
jgi:hypothetical protein